jgi:undecaprenyl-phosphate 4-deoxy-4-formamido-L-arabinose transferase
MNHLKQGISVVIPVYNSSETLVELTERISMAFQHLSQGFELILVNDGSHDASWAVIEGLCAKFQWIRGICLIRNYGQHNALLAGIRAARYEITVTMDDDLQHPPDQASGMLRALNANVDVVYGIPEVEPHGFLRGIASRLTKLSLRYAFGSEEAKNVSAFRVFRTKLRDGFQQFQSPFVSVDVLLSWSTKRFSSVKVLHLPREIGVSNYSFFSLLRHAATLITGYSVWPLQLASLLGFFITFFGCIVFGFVFINYALTGSKVAGFPFLASIIAIFSGAQMFSLGIIGIYLARMHFRLMDRPVYTVDKQLN